MKRTDEEILEEAYSVEDTDILYQLKREAKNKDTKKQIQKLINENSFSKT